MTIRRRVLALASAGIVVVSVAVASLPVSAQAQQKNAKKFDKAQQQDADELKAAVTAVQGGATAPSDMALALESCDFFKTAVGDTYVAFTVSVDSDSLASPAMALMLRVVDRNAAAGTTPATLPASDGGRRDAAAPRGFAYEDLDFTSVRTAVRGEPGHVSRAFHVPAGDYDLYFGLKERSTGEKKQKTKIGVLKQSIAVPDYSGGDITTSSIVAGGVKALEKALPADQERDNPYTIGNFQLSPKVGTKYATTDELSIYFQIYNETLDAARRPNIQIDYIFYLKQADGEKRIGKSDPQVLNANTLTPMFDPSKHQLASGESWPLTVFKPGDYRLEIAITDKISGKVVTKNVTFSVS